jgi:hypothetical protein
MGYKKLIKENSSLLGHSIAKKEIPRGFRGIHVLYTIIDRAG